MSRDGKRAARKVNLPVSPVKKTSAFEAVRSEVLRLIETGVISPGDQLPPEPEFAAQLGVSRGILREALRSLRTLGILEAQSGRGTFVSDHAQLLNTERFSTTELLEIRTLLEVAAVGLAIKRGTPDDMRRLSDIADAVRDSPSTDVSAWNQLNSVLHLAIATAAKNDALVMIGLQIRRMTIEQTGIPESVGSERRLEVIAQHTAILEAIINLDEDAAAEAMLEHMISSQKDGPVLGREYSLQPLYELMSITRWDAGSPAQADGNGRKP